jgi:xanthine dehydrogenase YagS FAD-binding subunit
MTFRYVRPTDAPDAGRALAEPTAVPLGGGTDLLVTIREGLVAPETLVDLRRVRGHDAISTGKDGTLTIGAAARLADIAQHPDVRSRFAVLAQACEAVGTTQLREMGTLGGNLCQRPRCWYFRRGVACFKSGGTSCPAVQGENQYLGILGGGPCHAPHPSDPAVALTALDATVIVMSADHERRVPMGAFYAAMDVTRETVLEPGEYVRGVAIPAASAGPVQRYEKLMQRGAWDFALVSLAAVKRTDGDVRLVLGGVAPAPWRVTSSIEEDVASGGLDDDTIAVLAERALYDAAPLSGNGYKVTQAEALLRRAIAALVR